MQELDSTNRFSDRVSNYRMFRPEYPNNIITFLRKHVMLSNDFIIADIGSGTGIFSRLLLNAGYSVFAVEPNGQMRSSAEALLLDYSGFTSVDGTAEKSSLPNSSVDLVTVAQAFHWFKPKEAKIEFERILKPSGHVCLIWNILQSNTAFLQAYSMLKEKYSEKIKHEHRANLESIKDVFYPATVITEKFGYSQLLDKKGLIGHLLSFSTIPLDKDPRYPEMMQELSSLYDEYNDDELVKLEYETQLYLIPF